MIIISVDGNIGSGKSEVLKYLKSKGYLSYLEQVEKWKDWLQAYYSDIPSNALGFQLQVLLSNSDIKTYIKTKIETENYVNQQLNITSDSNLKDKCMFVERSAFTTHNIFAKLLYDDHIFNNLQFKLLEDYYEKIGWKPDIIIYLRSDPEICYQRIISRQRNGETTKMNGNLNSTKSSVIPLDYLQKLHNKHEEVYSDSDNSDNSNNSNNISNTVKNFKKVYIVNADLNITEVYKTIDIIIEDLIKINFDDMFK